MGRSDNDNDSAKERVRIARTIANQCIGVRVRLLNRRVTRIYDVMLRSHGLRLSQLNILTAVSLRGPIEPSRVGRILSIEKSTLSRNVRLMEANGWLATRAGVGKGHLLRVTAKGSRLLRDVVPAWRKAQKEVGSLLGDRAVESIAEVVAAIWAAEAQS